MEPTNFHRLESNFISFPLSENNQVDQVITSNEDFGVLFEGENNTYDKIRNTVVLGKILKITDDFLLVDIGLKSEGLINTKEISETPDLNINDFHVGGNIEVFVESVEGVGGRSIISFTRARKEKIWEQLKIVLANSEIVTGRIDGRVKGGFAVNLKGIVAFLPGSQIDVRPVNDINDLLDRDLKFKILKMDDERGNVVVSRKVIREEEYNKEVDELLLTINVGMILEGTVKNLTDYGAFVDLGKIDGLLHITDMSWKRIIHPSEILKIGQVVKVIVTKYDENRRQLSLGLKQLTRDPWLDLIGKYSYDTIYSGAISNITDYGVFVALEAGVEGLVHVSEIDWSKNIQPPKQTMKLGQEVSVKIIQIDTDHHRISLSMKRCISNPWNDFETRHKVGDVLDGVIKNIADFGIFIGLENGVDGLAHISDFSWGSDGKKELEQCKKDQKIKVKILGMQVEKERIALGIKQLEDNPFKEDLGDIEKNQIITCIVKAKKENGLEVLINNKITSFIKRFELSKERTEQRVDRFTEGEKLDVMVMGVDYNSNKIIVSVRAAELKLQKDTIDEYGSTDSGASLGDILGNKYVSDLDNQKNVIESPTTESTDDSSNNEPKE